MNVNAHHLYSTVSPDVSYVAIIDHFRQFCVRGEIKDVYVSRNTHGRGEGFARVTFSSEEDLRTSLQVSLPDRSEVQYVVCRFSAGEKENFSFAGVSAPDTRLTNSHCERDRAGQPQRLDYPGICRLTPIDV